MGWEERINRARELHRPSLKDWECDGLYNVFPEFASDLIHHRDRDYESFVGAEQGACCHGGISITKLPVLLDAASLPAQEFWDRYESTEIPCVIRGIPQGSRNQEIHHNNNNNDNPTRDSTSEETSAATRNTEAWPAIQNWTFEGLRNNSDLRDCFFKCGEDDDGHSVKVKLKHFLRYTRSNRDDSPLYIFDSSFDDDPWAQRLLQDYSVPIYFRDDLFRYVSESRRPPYRWFLIGPERSGSTVHVDPLATNAWNTLIQGTKRWVLFPPHVHKSIVKAKGLISDDEDDEAIHYFMFILPRIKRQAAAALQQPDTSSSPYHNFFCLEFTQHAGETVFVPNGWWHAVLNLTDTIAVTQNFCSPRNFDKVWRQARTERPRLAWKWLQTLQSEHPELALRAWQMNHQDRFAMKYDPVEIARREKNRREDASWQRTTSTKARPGKNESKDSDKEVNSNSCHCQSHHNGDGEDCSHDEEDDNEEHDHRQEENEGENENCNDPNDKKNSDLRRKKQRRRM